MTNEHVANIAITVTAAMLATAAVAFTLSGNAPSDPRAADLPVVSVGASTANAAAPAVSTTSSGILGPGSLTALTQHAPSTTTQPHSGSAATPSGTSAGAVAGSGAASTASGAAASHDAEDREDDHEVVVPEVHETEEPEGKPEDKGSVTPKKD
jgi:hypothetical protein